VSLIKLLQQFGASMFRWDGKRVHLT